MLVYGESVPTVSAFSLLASGSTIALSGLNPEHADKSGPATLTLTGAGFVAGSTVSLVAADNQTEYAPTTFSVDGFTQISATFPSSIPAGTYSVRVRSGVVSATLTSAFTLTAAGQPHLETHLILPSALGRHTTATLYIHYANTGTAAMPAPLLVLSNPNPDRPLLTLDASLLTSGFWTSAIPDGFSTSISILASGNTPGLLQAGESVTVPVYYAGLQQPYDFSHSTVPFTLGVVDTNDTTPVDWESLKAGLRPGWISAGAWDPIFSNLVAQAGTTSGSYVRLLDKNVQALRHLGETVTDVGQLWGFSILQANGLNPISTLASAVDASMVTPGVSLSFGRSFGETLNDRYQVGPLGQGWSVTWQAALSVLADGTVVITADDGSPYRYQPDSRSAGRYFAAAGDLNSLHGQADGTFLWTDRDGIVTSFRADGKLDHVQDPNGNRITAVYDASGRLSGLTHSSGQSLALAYNAAGLIASVTDSTGRQALYTYDASNQLLISVQTPDGTTRYGYTVGQGTATEHALTSIEFPDGTHRFYSYDAQGRLVGTTRDGGQEGVAFSYPTPGQVTATDSLGDSATIFYDARGLPVETRDALGNISTAQYDTKTLQIGRITEPTGQTRTFAYDAQGNITSATDELGYKTTFLSGQFNRVTALTDANGNTTTFDYDPSGNPLRTTYADGSSERSTFDPLGDPLSFTNRNGQTITYAYNAAGQVTSQTFPDGSHSDFSYDARGNLRTAVDATGTITLTYDAADRLTRVDYPGGLFLQFTLDSAGRRTRMVDQTGYTVNYQYDAVGRLAGLTDGANSPVVTYTYDSAGRLARKDNGNGTYITYQYDANGNVIHLINFAPDKTVSSQFDYTYDPLGRRTSMATLDGTWTYSYDDTGQLTHAVFASTNASVPSQDLAYNYDALGNRTSTVINGVATLYTANKLNEYTSVGGVAQSYDADGSRLSDGTDSFTYDALDRLISATTPGGTTNFAYDALGNLASSRSGVQMTGYENDPTGIGYVVGFLDENGNVSTHARYGLGLVSVTSPAGDPTYVSADALGNISDYTDAHGVLTGQLRYAPFGNVIGGSQSPGSFGFEGSYGVMQTGGGLLDMRARFYDATIGRFASVDPQRLSGGDVNFLAYAHNNPTNSIDPTGRSDLGAFGIGVGLTLPTALALAGFVAFGAVTTPILIIGGFTLGFGAAFTYAGLGPPTGSLFPPGTGSSAPFGPPQPPAIPPMVPAVPGPVPTGVLFPPGGGSSSPSGPLHPPAVPPMVPAVPGPSTDGAAHPHSGGSERLAGTGRLRSQAHRRRGHDPPLPHRLRERPGRDRARPVGHDHRPPLRQP